MSYLIKIEIYLCKACAAYVCVCERAQILL